MTVHYELATTSGSSGWRYSPTAYWPKDGSKLAFLAHAPASFSYYLVRDPGGNNDGTIATPTVSFTNTGLVVSDFCVRDQYYDLEPGTNQYSFSFENEPDLLYCDPIVDQTAVIDPTSSLARPVQIQFKHALAQVNFTARLKEPSANVVFISECEFKDEYSIASFNQNLSETGSAGVPSWTFPVMANKSAFYLPGLERGGQGVRIASTRNVELGGPIAIIPRDNLYMYPAYLNLAFLVRSDENPNGEQASWNIHFEEILGSQGFEMGKKYNIEIVFDVSRQEISFEPTVTEWETVSKTIEIAP